jgi:methylmalonyl-CoA/ethylmalonyl-CoA epimerase
MATPRKIAHAGYVVRNIDRSTQRFIDEGAELIIEPTADPIQGVWVSLVSDGSGLDIELVAPLTPGESPVESRLKRGGGLDHICYFVSNVEAALREEVESGATIVCPPTFACAFDRTIGFAHRRTALIVEFMSEELVAP